MTDEGKASVKEQDPPQTSQIFALRTMANREDQVIDFVASNAKRKGISVYALIFPHGTKGYVFLEAVDRQSAEQAAFNVPYARGVLPSSVQLKEIEHMLEVTKKVIDIRVNDIVEIITGPLKREQAKIVRLDTQRGDVIVNLIGVPVPMSLTLKLDAVKVIRRENEDAPQEE